MSYEKYYPAIKKCKLFYNLKTSEIEAALNSMNALIKRYEKGEIIYRFGEQVKYVVVVLSGETRSSMYEPIDHPFEITHGTVGQICMLPGSFRSDYYSSVEIVAYTDAEILFLDINNFLYRHEVEKKWHSIMMGNIIQALADHSIDLKSRIRIIAHKKIRDRIILYLETIPTNEEGIKVIPMKMSDLAKFLHVEKGAMYKTIKEMQAEGILEWEKGRVKLLNNKKQR